MKSIIPYMLSASLVLAGSAVIAGSEPVSSSSKASHSTVAQNSTLNFSTGPGLICQTIKISETIICTIKLYIEKENRTRLGPQLILPFESKCLGDTSAAALWDFLCNGNCKLQTKYFLITKGSGCTNTQFIPISTCSSTGLGENFKSTGPRFTLKQSIIFMKSQTEVQFQKPTPDPNKGNIRCRVRAPS